MDEVPLGSGRGLGDEAAIGAARRSGDCTDPILLSGVAMLLNEFCSVKFIVSVNRADEKFGMPHEQHIHNISPAMASQTGVDIPMHSLWYQPSHWSHWKAFWFPRTAFIQIIHGCLGLEGPGFSSMSPASESKKEAMSEDDLPG